ncbi:MAG: GH3 family domain-containing protein [Bacteroidota bacterium]
MPIIGKLIKKTNEISYKRSLNKSKEYYHQVITLVKLLEKAKNTSFGKQHNFKNILFEDEVVDAFQTNVPITEYNEFYENWLKDCIDGKRDVIWPGRIRHYALSSGTTGSPSKRIPITIQTIRSFQKTTMKQISTLHELNLPDAFYEASILVVGGSTKLTKTPTHIEGDLSGILKKYTSRVVAPFTKPGERITKLKNWNEKLELMVEKAPEWNIGTIAGVPSWCILLMERVIERYKLNNIHEMWPNLQIYMHGGVFMAPYVSRLNKVLGRDIYTLDTYLASEGYFGYQVAPGRKGMELLLTNGIFFEFVPFNSDYFKDDGTLQNQHHAMALNEVEEGVDYALVISTNAGLWRYMIGDLVRFVDKERFEIIITGRIKQFMSLVGEHLSLDNINNAINETGKEGETDYTEFCLYADEKDLRHYWFIGCDQEVDEVDVMKKLDAKICELNDDYASSRKYNLKDPILKVVPTKAFYGFLESIGKLGAQNKFPRVLNETQKEKWLNYLKENKYI